MQSEVDSFVVLRFFQLLCKLENEWDTGPVPGFFVCNIDLFKEDHRVCEKSKDIYTYCSGSQTAILTWRSLQKQYLWIHLMSGWIMALC